jgi:phospholipase C
MAALDPIGTLVIVMMENRSFDHMAGHLSLIDPKLPVDGLVAPDGSSADYRVPLTPLQNGAYLNLSAADGALHYPFHMQDNPLTTDLPHDRYGVQTQLGRQDANGTYSMEGFVDAYYGITPTRMDLVDPMGFFTAAEAPIADFFARQFTTCDRWFSSIPTDTQPNRLMAYNGETQTDRTSGLPPDQPVVLDWMDKNNIDWRVYSDDISFFALIRHLWPKILTSDRFRKFSSLANDVLSADPKDPASFPKVIFVEPSYNDSPIHPDHDPNDDHAPLPIGFGEDFLRQVYQALTPKDNLAVWNRMVMIVTYDEHGGFYDHVSPLSPVTTSCGAGNQPFTSTGPRVPSFIVSPFVSAGSIYHNNLDHTSILEFLAEWLTPGQPYSPAVAARLAEPGFALPPGKGKISSIFDLLDEPRKQPPEEPLQALGGMRLSPGKKVAHTPNELAFEQAVQGMIEADPNGVANKYPGLVHWDQNN